MRQSFPTGKRRHAIGGFIGAVTAMMGTGGGTVGVPILSMSGAPIRSAVATASAFGLVISIPATLAARRLPARTLPWGVDLAKSIPPLLAKRCFAAFLGLTVLRMV